MKNANEAVYEEKTVDVVTLGWPGPCRTVEVLNPSCLMTAIGSNCQFAEINGVKFVYR